MNIDLKTLKKYWFMLIFVIPYLGLASYAEGLRPVFYFQLQNATCASIVAGYAAAVRAKDAAMIEYWKREAEAYQCRLPPI